MFSQRIIPFAVVVAIPSALGLAGSALTADAVADAADSPSPAIELEMADAPLEPFQDELLTIAFEAASSFPLSPHIKNRSRAQQWVIEGCLELDQPNRALGYIPAIANWRRGAMYAAVADYLALRGQTEPVDALIELALDHAQNTQQSWRRESVIRRVNRVASIAAVAEQAREDRADEGDADDQADPFSLKDVSISDEDFDHIVEGLDAMIATDGYDEINSALRIYAELYDRFYHDAPRREFIEGKIRDGWNTLPYIRFEVIVRLAEAALAHGASEHASSLVDEANDLKYSYRWRMREDMPMRATLVKLRWRSGDRDIARSDADMALEMFQREMDEQFDYLRADMIRPLAEAYQVMGQTDKARQVYRLAAEQGAKNPNIRPRTFDLTKTCVSMAVAGVEPDEKTWSLIRTLHGELVDP